MEDYCSRHILEQALDDWNLLPLSTQHFLQQLDLPSLHPFCNESSQSLLFPSAPEMGPPTEPFDDTVLEAIITAFYYYIPPSISLFLVWFFFFVGFIAPLGTLASIWISMKERNRSVLDHHPFLGVITLVSSWVILTDDQYLLEFGRMYGVALLSTSLLALRPHRKHVPLLLSVLIVSYWMSPWSPDDPEVMTPHIQPGVYYNTEHPFVSKVVARWRQNLPDYFEVATPWQFTGDARTGMPYTLNYVPKKPFFHRVWMSTIDEEYAALDIAFPQDGHNWDKPLFLVLHGLNGGSKEGYVIDFCHTRNEEGSTCVVLIARGLADTPLQGWTLFHGARTSDVHSAASILREKVLQDEQTLAAVGYSLGAIVLNNYVASYGHRVALDVSVSISGALDCTYQQHFVRSQRIWQPMIVAFMKDAFLYSKWGDRIMKRLGPKHFQGLLRAKDVVEADLYTGVMYNNYNDHEEFYSDMSAILASNNNTGHRGYFAIPHLVLQAFDDPISTWRTNAANEKSSVLYPSNLVAHEESSNLVLLLTSLGGHLGWPMGWMPHSWDYMNNLVAAGFVSSYVESVKARKQHNSSEYNE